MRILQIIQKKQFRGAEIFTCQLAQQLRNKGHEVMIVALEDGSAELPFTGGIEVLHADLSKRFYDFVAWRRLAALIYLFNPDIVQANAADTLKYAVFSKLLFKWKTKLIFRNANKMSDFIRSEPKKILNLFFLNRVDAIASVSEICRKDILGMMFPKHPVTVTLPVGIDEVNINAYTDLSCFDLTKDKKVFLSVAGFVPEKNHISLLRIFKTLHEKHPDSVLLLIGTGKLQSVLEQKAHELNLKDVVLFAGNRTDVSSIMSQCTALLMPSLIEGLPAVVLESFAARLPVIAYCTGGIPEVLTDATGWPVQQGDEISFLHKIEEVLQADKELLKSKTETAYELVTSSYLNSALAKGFINLYERVINEV